MTETGDRRAFLAPVEARLRHGPHPNVAHPPPPAPDEIPRPRHLDLDTDDLPGAFSRAAARVDATVHDVRSDGDVDTALRAIVDGHGIREAVVATDEEAVGIAERVATLGVRVEPYGVAAGAQADLGITGAVAAVAATGSVVLDAGRAGGRGASLLPRVHLAVVPVARVVPATADVLRPLAGRPDRLPSNLVLVTGPSRTGDIEQILTLGVHGPVAVEILLDHRRGAGPADSDHPPPSGTGRV